MPTLRLEDQTAGWEQKEQSFYFNWLKRIKMWKLHESENITISLMIKSHKDHFVPVHWFIIVFIWEKKQKTNKKNIYRIA